jgi:hypothetical protein
MTLTCKGLLIPVDDLSAAITSMETLGYAIRFRDGSRYAAMAGPGGSVGLMAGEERIIDADVAVNFCLRAGGSLVRPLENGPHERRGVVRIAGAILAVISAKLNV